MQIKISTRHGHLSEPMQEKIREKVQRLERYFERLTAIEITIDLTQAELPLVNLNVSAEHKHDFVCASRRRIWARAWTLSCRKWNSNCEGIKKESKTITAARAPARQKRSNLGATRTGRTPCNIFAETRDG